MNPKMNLGINFIQDAPMPQVITWCKTAEEVGFRWIGVVDSQLLVREFYVSYAAYVLNTSRASFIPMVSNVVTRHPSVAAGAMLSLYELAPGRVSLGLASGDSAVYGIGLTQAKVEEIRSYVKTVRGLLNGEEVTWQGKTFRPEWHHWKPPVPIKIYVAASGPKTIKMAAQVADGVIGNLGVGGTRENVQQCFALVKEGAQEVGRDPKEVEVWWHLPAALAETREEAITQVGWSGIQFLARATMEGKQIPDELKPALRRLYQEENLSVHGRPNPRIGQLARELGVLDFMVERGGGMMGSPEDIRRGVQRLYDHGVRNLVLNGKGRDRGEVIRVLGKEVLPYFS